MNRIVSIKETSAIFLAIVLVSGTIALTVPSFSVEAQATSDREKDYDNDKKDYYEKDRDYKSRDYDEKKSYDKDDYKSEYSSYGKYDDRDHDESKKESSKSVFIKKVKCNNINVNLNGIDVDIGGLPNNIPVTDSVAVAQEEDEDDETESNSIENEDKSYESRDGKLDANTNSKIVCINNNNNVVVAEEEPETCEDCFTTVLDEEELDDLIQAIAVDSLGIVSSLEELCDFIDDSSGISEGRAFISDRLFVLGGDVGISEDEINEILDCLEELLGVDFPREIIEDDLTAQQMNWKS